MKRLSGILILWTVGACAIATRFTITLPPHMKAQGTLELRPMDLHSSNRVWVTGYGPRSQGAFSRQDAEVFDDSLRETLIQNRVFSNITPAVTPGTPASPSERKSLQPGGPPERYTLDISLLNHVLAGDTGGIMEVAWSLQEIATVHTGRFAVYCPYSPSVRIFDCLNRAVVYRLVLDTTNLIGHRTSPPVSEYSGAVYFDSALAAATRLPNTLTQEDCIKWENTIFGPHCEDSMTIRLSNINWATYIREPGSR